MHWVHYDDYICCLISTFIDLNYWYPSPDIDPNLKRSLCHIEIVYGLFCVYVSVSVSAGDQITMSEDWDEPESSTIAGNTAAFQPVSRFFFNFVSNIFGASCWCILTVVAASDL